MNTTTHPLRAMMKSNDLGRMYIIVVSADGACFVRRRGSRSVMKGLLPVFSTDTRDQADQLIVRHRTLARDRSGIYRLNRSLFGGDVDDLERVADAFRESYGRVR